MLQTAYFGNMWTQEETDDLKKNAKNGKKILPGVPFMDIRAEIDGKTRVTVLDLDGNKESSYLL